jgi:hypothetical protein
MSAWLLLLLTCACAALAVDAFRMNSPLREPPARFWPREWKTGQQHMTLAEQDVRQRQSRVSHWSFVGLGWLAWMFSLMTVLLGVLTLKAFLA